LYKRNAKPRYSGRSGRRWKSENRDIAPVDDREAPEPLDGSACFDRSTQSSIHDSRGRTGTVSAPAGKALGRTGTGLEHRFATIKSSEGSGTLPPDHQGSPRSNPRRSLEADPPAVKATRQPWRPTHRVEGGRALAGSPPGNVRPRAALVPAQGARLRAPGRGSR